MRTLKNHERMELSWANNVYNTVEIISLNRLTDSTEINEHRSIREKRQPTFSHISIPV